MRPSPQDVLAWFTGDIGDEDLFTYVTALQADPTWTLIYRPGPPIWELYHYYSPTGESHIPAGAC